MTYNVFSGALNPTQSINQSVNPMVTGQLADTPTRGLSTRGLDTLADTDYVDIK